MRSDICNRFSCESLARLQAAQRNPGTVHAVLIVRRKQDHWNRAEPGVDNAVNARAVLLETGVMRFARSALRPPARGTNNGGGAPASAPIKMLRKYTLSTILDESAS